MMSPCYSWGRMWSAVSQDASSYLKTLPDTEHLLHSLTDIEGCHFIARSTDLCLSSFFYVMYQTDVFILFISSGSNIYVLETKESICVSIQLIPRFLIFLEFSFNP